MASNVSDINVLLTGSSSDTLMGATGSTGSSDNGAVVSAFQGKLDTAMATESTSEVSTVVENTGDGFSQDTSVQTETSPLDSEQRANLSAGQKTTELSTVDEADYTVRTVKQKVSTVEDALENGGGIEFLMELKNLLLSLSNCDLDNLSIDEDGLEALANLLVQAGFDQASVEELISNLTLTLEDADLISVSDFMDDLFELPLAEDEDVTGAEVLMPTSDLPYIKSLLTMMGVDEETISSIMNEVSEGTQGFDFEAFIEQLEQLLETASAAGTSYQADTDDDSFTTLLEQLSLDTTLVDSDESMTFTTLIEAFEQKFDQMKDALADQTGTFSSGISITDTADVLATESGRQTLFNQLFSGLNVQEDGEETVNSSAMLSAGSDAVVREIEDRFQVRFMNQVSARTANDVSAAGNTFSTDIQTEESGFDNAFKVANSFSDTAGTTRESASQIAVKTAQAEAAVLENAASATSSQSGDTMSKGADAQALVFGMEKSTATVGTSGTQRVQQAFSTLPDFVTRQVGKSIVRSFNSGDDAIRMQLKPPELGKVYMSIDHNGSSMKVSVITEHQSAKDILAANVNEIKTMLSSSGISLESFEVNMSSDFQQSMADARTQDQSGGKRQAKNGANGDSQEDTADNPTVQTDYINDSGSLHFVA